MRLDLSSIPEARKQLFMPTAHVLTNAHGNVWYLTTPQAQVLDSVIAANHAGAALAVRHLLPRDGVWEDREEGQYAYCVAGRSGVFRHARHH